ncbi:hypothetical protein Ancab_007814 [Ancistrocladus abbreviatus]
MASTAASLLPQQQQQPQEAVPGAEVTVSSSTGAWNKSGSIGPFLAVMSVLIVLAIVSCVVGRICVGRPAARTPLESIKSKDHFGWLRHRLWKCKAGRDVEMGGGKVAAASGGQ